MQPCNGLVHSHMQRLSVSSSKFLWDLNLSDNNFSGSLQDRFGENGLDELNTLDLSQNSFTGTIPTSLENLDGIRTIRLQYNQFTDSVPGEICNICWNPIRDRSHHVA